MLTILKNPRLKAILSLASGFSFGLIIFGSWRDWIGPTGVLLAVLAAMPVLAWGFYLHFGALAAQLESAQKSAQKPE